MLDNFKELHTLLRIWLKQLGDEVLRYTRETSWPLDTLIQDIVKELFLVFADEGWVSR